MTNLDLNITQGSTFEKTVTITGSDGTAVDISGFQFEAIAVEKFGHTGSLLDFTIESGSPLSDGKVDLSLTATQTASVKSSILRWELEYTDRNNKKFKSHQGKVYLMPQITI